VIAIVGVVVLGLAGIAIAVLSAIAGAHPNRAAMVMVLVMAGGGLLFAVLGLGLLVTGIGRGTGTSGAAIPIVYEPKRVVGGLVVAGGLLLLATWLIRSGDWDRHD
jgi:hypothetical protein